METENFSKDFKEHRISIFSDDEIVYENERALYCLICDHPYFISEIKKIRELLGISRDGFKDAKSSYSWETANKNNEKRLFKAVEKLVYKFTIKPTYISSLKFFVYDYILSPNIVKHLLPEIGLTEREKKETKEHTKHKKASVVVIKTKKDINFNKYLFTAETLYLEIYSHTTLRDVKRAFAEITKKKKDLQPYVISRVQVIAREIWRMSRDGLNNYLIGNIIETEFNANHFDEVKIAVYKKRYYKALLGLKKFKFVVAKKRN